MNLYYLLLINKFHIDCYCVKGLWCCFPIPLLIFIYSVNMQIWAFLTRSQCKVSDTQVTVKACGLLVCCYIHLRINYLFGLFFFQSVPKKSSPMKMHTVAFATFNFLWKERHLGVNLVFAMRSKYRSCYGIATSTGMHI